VRQWEAAWDRGCWQQLMLRPRRMYACVCAGKRRYDRKQSGYGGQTKPVFHKKVRTCRSRLTQQDWGNAVDRDRRRMRSSEAASKQAGRRSIAEFAAMSWS
jgi:hypothetical protein